MNHLGVSARSHEWNRYVRSENGSLKPKAFLENDILKENGGESAIRTRGRSYPTTTVQQTVQGL